MLAAFLGDLPRSSIDQHEDCHSLHPLQAGEAWTKAVVEATHRNIPWLSFSACGTVLYFIVCMTLHG